MNSNSGNARQIIAENVDIVDVIGNYLALSKAGKDFKGLCPFHSDKNPSLQVSQSKQIFKCFSCGAGGGVIKFMMAIETVSYSEALQKLTEKYNLPLDLHHLSGPEKTENQLKLLEITKEIHSFYQGQLINPPSKLKKYLNGRRFTPRLCQKYELGWAPENQKELFEFLIRKNFHQTDIFQTDLFTEKNGEISDYFRERLIFPLHNCTNELIGFSGRTINPRAQTKFLLSRENAIFAKSNVFFNWKLIQDEFKALQKIYIVEGFADAIMLTENGIPTIAMLGTSLSDAQIQALNENFLEFVLVPDGDEPGYQSVLKNSLKMKMRGLKTFIWDHHTKLDPDELVRTDQNFLKNREENIMTPLQFIIAHHEQITNEAETEQFQKETHSFLAIATETERFWFEKTVATKYSLPRSIFVALNQPPHRPESIKSLIKPRPPATAFRSSNEQQAPGAEWEKMTFYLMIIDGAFRAKALTFSPFFCETLQAQWSWLTEQKFFSTLNFTDTNSFLTLISEPNRRSWFKMIFDEIEQEYEQNDIQSSILKDDLLARCRESSLKLKKQMIFHQHRNKKIDTYEAAKQLDKKEN